ncbi:MAG: hypothetical protein SWX82_25900 [Cyanobacteriota bacterium]|nr:hypothetical protein [Cyanobacteriota bacterium]
MKGIIISFRASFNLFQFDSRRKKEEERRKEEEERRKKKEGKILFCLSFNMSDMSAPFASTAIFSLIYSTEGLPSKVF